jgi:hypothetical protein
MRRLLALALHPVLYGTLVSLQMWRTHRLFPDISDGGLGASLLIAAALLAQMGFACSLIPFAKRVRAARVARVAVFAILTTVVGILLCMLLFQIGSQLEARWLPRAGHVLFLSAPLWATSLATFVCAFWLLPRSERGAIASDAQHT